MRVKAAFVNDRYFDLAIVANFLVNNDAEEKTFLQEYFGQPPDEYQLARFFLMRQVMHMCPLRFPSAVEQADQPERKIDSILGLSSAHLGGRGRPYGQRYKDRLWQDSLGAALT